LKKGEKERLRENWVAKNGEWIETGGRVRVNGLVFPREEGGVKKKEKKEGGLAKREESVKKFVKTGCVKGEQGKTKGKQNPPAASRKPNCEKEKTEKELRVGRGQLWKGRVGQTKVRVEWTSFSRGEAPMT